MLARVIRTTALLAMLAFASVACSVFQATPTESAGPVPAPMPTPDSDYVTPVPADTPAPLPAPVPTPNSVYLTKEIPPCTPLPGSAVDPCDYDEGPLRVDTGLGSVPPPLGDAPAGVGDVLLLRHPLYNNPLYDTYNEPRDYLPHMVLRGTYLPDTVRCNTGDVFRTADHRYGLEFAEGLPSIKCYSDVRVNAYIVGSGPATLTVMVMRDTLYDGELAPEVERLRQAYEARIRDRFSGREFVIFIGPPEDLSTEAWRTVAFRALERREDGTVIVVHRDRWRWRIVERNRDKYPIPPPMYQTLLPVLEMPLPTFVQQMKEVQKARMAQYGGRILADESLPMLMTDVNQLRDYYVEVGAYDHPDGPPAQPPLSCVSLVPNQAANPGLLADCKALAAARDTLQGTARLDWSSSKPIAQWQGVTVGGSPKRVQRLALDDLGLTGTMPADLGNLTGLDRLSMEYNSLSGPIPTTLGKLTGLTSLSLSGNGLTGAIPPALGGLSRLTSLDLADNELTGTPPTELGNLRALTYLSLGGNRLAGPVPAWVSGLRSLDHLYLDNNRLTGPIPATLGQLTGMRVLSLGGNQLTGGIPAFVTNLSRLEELNLARNRLTGAIPVGLLALPDLEYLYLSGNRLTGCVPAGLLDVATNDLARLNLATCPNAAPVFAQVSYAFSVAANAAAGTVVGTVTATDADAGDAVTYAITPGNGGGWFAIDGATGAIRVAKALTSGTTHSLTVQASDRNRGAATVTVTITVGGA